MTRPNKYAAMRHRRLMHAARMRRAFKMRMRRVKAAQKNVKAA